MIELLFAIQPYAIIICVVIIFYIRTIEYSIIVDDIRQYAMIKKGAFKWRKERLGNTLFSKIKYINKFICSRLYGGGTFGDNTIKDHALATGLHALTCCLIYNAFGSNHISFWTALLYAVNPINNQTAIWINGRRYQIVVILSLLALIFKPWGIIFYLYSFNLQVTATFLPVLFSDISPLFLLLPPFLMLIGFKRFKSKYDSRMLRIANRDQKTWGWGRIKVVIKSYGFFFFKMLHPVITMFNYPNLIQWGVTKKGNADAYAVNFAFWQGIFALGATLWLATTPELTLMALFVFLGTLQWSAIICAFQQLADRYISVVNVFMMYMVSYLLFTHLPNYAPILLFGLACSYVTQLNITMRMFKSIETFFAYQLYYHPEMSRNRIIYADSYLSIQDITSAWLIVKEGLRYEPDDFELLFRAAQCAIVTALFDKAEEYIARAEQNYYIDSEEVQGERIRRLKNALVDTKRKAHMFEKKAQEEFMKIRKNQARP